jgi:leader peptidase (prepilin peptidase) / N-methyltransferase
MVVMSALVVVLAALGGAVAGAVAGVVARLLLARLRRGTHVRWPWCELAIAAVWAGAAAGCAAGLLPVGWLPVLLGLGWLGVAAAVVDLRHGRLPDALTLPALPAALVLLVPVGPEALGRALAGAAAGAAVHAAVHLVDPRALGAGDVKLAAPLGAVLAAAAWSALALAAVLAAVFTATAAAVRAVARPRREGGRCGALPHGPSMLAAAWLVTACLVAAGASGG